MVFQFLFFNTIFIHAILAVQVSTNEGLNQITQILLNRFDGDATATLRDFILDPCKQVFDEIDAEHMDDNFLQVQGDLIKMVDDSTLLSFKDLRDEIGDNLIFLLVCSIDRDSPREYFDMIERLLDIGYDVNDVNGYGDTLLHYMVWYGTEADVQMLISRGAQLDVMDKFHSSPLYRAANMGSDQGITSFLVDRGCDLALAFEKFALNKNFCVSARCVSNLSEQVLRMLNSEQCKYVESLVALRRWGLPGELSCMIVGRMYQEMVLLWVQVVRSAWWNIAGLSSHPFIRQNAIRGQCIRMLQMFENCLRRLHELSGSYRMHQLKDVWRRLRDVDTPLAERIASVVES